MGTLQGPVGQNLKLSSCKEQFPLLHKWDVVLDLLQFCFISRTRGQFCFPDCIIKSVG